MVGDDQENGKSVVKTTMVVRLHPGQTRKLSALSSDNSDQTGGQAGKKKDSLGWVGEVQAENDPASSCGLEISFQSVPQDIDIKIITDSQATDSAQNKGIKEGSQGKRPQLMHRNSLVRGSIDMTGNKSRK